MAGVRDVYICPGSRNAPLTIAFVRSDRFNIQVVPDERCAAYMAMGSSQGGNRPSVVITTSGTAAVNLYPATVEAFYQEIPLVLLTADRPPELIDQLDGQAIRQNGLFRNHIKHELSININEALTEINEKVSEAVISSNVGKRGPVHINIPFEEPLYVTLDSYKIDQVVGHYAANPEFEKEVDTGELLNSLSQFKKIIVIAGQGQWNTEVIETLNTLSQKNCVVIGDIISNAHMVEDVIKFTELIIPSEAQKKLPDLTPDLLITFGLSIISKNLKLALRKMEIKNHWHITPDGPAPNPFFSEPKAVNLSVEKLLNGIAKKIGLLSPEFKKEWKDIEARQSGKFSRSLDRQRFFELTAVERILKFVPESSVLHLGNSLPVRYANYIGNKKNIRVFCNRGTSGIDGSVSTFIGHANSNPDLIHTLIVGDISFFYDRNALWCESLPGNIRIIILNNHGGGIFRMIDGPEKIAERDRYFVNLQQRSAKSTVEDAGLRYIYCKDEAGLKMGLKDLYSLEEPCVLEFESLNSGTLRVIKEDLNRYSS